MVSIGISKERRASSKKADAEATSRCERTYFTGKPDNWQTPAGQEVGGVMKTASVELTKLK